MRARAVPPGVLARVILSLVALSPQALAAHTGERPRPHDLWTAWSLEPWLLVTTLVPAWIYGRGVRRLWARAGAARGLRRWRAWCGTVGFATLFVALISPLSRLGGALFSAHMAQHQLLMIVTAPLLVLAAPGIAMPWAFGERARHRLAAIVRPIARSATWRWAVHPLGAWLLHAIATWLWHSPPLYGATLRSESVHALQHASFLGTALLFWWSVLPLRAGGARAHVIAFASVFTTAVHTSLLGALLTFAARPWYPAYAGRVEPWGLTLLEDQQLGGLVMWVPGGFVFTGAAIGILAYGLRRMESRARLAALGRRVISPAGGR